MPTINNQYNDAKLYACSGQYFSRLLSAVVTLLLGAMLVSCTAMDSHPVRTEGEVGQGLLATTPSNVGGSQEITSGASDVDRSSSTPELDDSPKPILYTGTDQLVRMPKSQKPVRFLGDAVTLNFEQAPLTEVVHAIMGDILELDYVVEHPIGGEVTLRTRSPVPRDELLDILESLLKANNALMVRDKSGRFFVSGSGQMSRLKPSVAASASGVVGFSTIIVPLKYISASAMAEILQPVAEEGAFVRVDNLRNILMLQGTRAQLSGWQDIVTTFDVDMLKGMSVGMFPIEHSSIEEVQTALDALLNGGGGSDAAAQLSGIGSAIRVIPVPRLSSLLVVTPRAHFLRRVETWIRRFDQAPSASAERSLHVYEVQNSNAEHLANLLSGIYGGTGTGSSKKAGVAPGLTPEKVSSDGYDGTQNSSGKKSQKATSSTTSSTFSMGDVRVVADEANNALLIYATGKEYGKILPALERLDIAATQVIIEASIVEVTLDDSLKYGLEWTFNRNLDGNKTGLGQLINGAGSAPAINVPGFAYSVLDGSGSIKAVLNALAEKSLLNVISSPSVMVLDNHSAEIQVGQQVPIAGSQVAASNNNTVTRSVTYRDTGVLLKVTPSVNAGGMVTMDIEQSVTDVGPTGFEGSSTFLERKITSKVAVRSTESIVLGGLIRENKQNSSAGVPLLHEIPLLGGLFGAKDNTNVRTELLVVLTPRAIYNDSQLRDISNEMRAQMRGLELIDAETTSAYLTDPKLQENAKPVQK